MAGVFEPGGIKTFMCGIETSARRLKSNIDAIIEKYNKPFPEADEINLSTLSIKRDNGYIRRITGCHKFGTSQLRSTKRKDELLQSQIGQNKSHIDANVSMAITREYNCYLRRPDDRAGEPSDAETLDSDSSDEDDAESEEEEEEEDENESTDSESDVDDLEEEVVEDTCSDKNSVVPESGRERVITGRKELGNESGADQVGKSGNAQVESRKVTKNEKEQVNEHEREWDNGSGRGQVNKPRRVLLKSGRELAAESGSIQLKSEKELTNESGNIQLKSGRELVNVSENVKLKSGRELINESESMQLKSGRELTNESQKDHIHTSEKAQSSRSGGEHISKSGTQLDNESRQGRNCVGVSRSFVDSLSTSYFDDSTCSALGNLSFISYQSPKRVVMETVSKRRANIPSEKKSSADSQNLHSEHSGTFIVGNADSSQRKPGGYYSSARLICLSPDRRKSVCAVQKQISMPDCKNLRKDDSVNMHTTFVKSGSVSVSSRCENRGSEYHAQLDSDGRHSENSLQKKMCALTFVNLQTDHSVNVDVTYTKSGLFGVSSSREGPVYESHVYLSPGIERCEKPVSKLHSPSSSGTGRCEKPVSKLHPPSSSGTERCEKPVSKLHPPSNSGTERCEKPVSKVHPPSNSGTGRYEDSAKKTRPATEGRNLQTNHPSSGNNMSTNRKSEHDLEKTYTSPFLNLPPDCSLDLDCSVNTENCLNMDVTFETSGLFGVSSRHEGSVLDSQVSLSSGTGRCEKPVSNVHPPSSSGTRRCEKPVSKLHPPSSSGTRRCEKPVSNVHPPSSSGTRRCEKPVSKLHPPSSSGTGRCEKPVSKLHPPSSSGTERCEKSVSKLHPPSSSDTRRCEKPVSNVHPPSSSGTGRCEKPVSNVHPPSSSGTRRCEKPVSKLHPPSNSGTEICEKPVSNVHPPSSSGTEICEKSVSKVHPPSSSGMRRCEKPVSKLHSPSSSGTGRCEKPVSKLHPPSSSGTERCEKPVSKVHPPLSSGTGRYEDVPHRTRSVTAGRNLQSDQPSSTSRMSTNVLQKANSCRKSLSDPSPKVHLMPEELGSVGSPSNGKDPTTKRHQSNTGCRWSEVSPRKQPAPSCQILGADLSSSGSQKPTAGCQNWEVGFSPKTDLVSEAMNGSTHAYNLRSKKSCGAQGDLASQSPGDVSLTSSLRKLNIHPSPAHLMLSPHSNVTPAHSNTAPAHSNTAPARSNMAPPQGLLAFPCSKLASPYSNSASSLFNLATPLSKMASPPSKMTSPLSNMASLSSNLASSRSHLASLHSKLASPPSNLASPPSNLASPSSNLASPPSSVSSPPSNVASPPSNVASPLSNVASPLSNVASPLSSVASPLSNVASPRSKLASPPSNFTTFCSSVSKQHNSNKTLIHDATPEPSNECVENLVTCGLYVESPNCVQKAASPEPQYQGTNNQFSCGFLHQILLSHGFDQEKWASARCEITTNHSSPIPAYGRLKRKASGSFTSDYFTDASASPKRQQTGSAARSDNDLVMNITLTLPADRTECLAASTCQFQRHGQQQTCLSELCCLHSSEQTTSHMDSSGHTFCHPCDHVSRHVVSRVEEDTATTVQGRRFAVAKKLRCLGSGNCANPGSSRPQPVEDNWCCWSECTSGEHCCYRPPSRTGSRVCECVKASSGQNSHDVPVQVPPHVNNSRVREWIEASKCTTNRRCNPVRCASCVPNMQQNQLTQCSSGQSAASATSSRLPSLRHVSDVSSSSHVPYHFQPARTENQQRFEDGVRNSTGRHHHNHAPSCDRSASKTLGKTCCSCVGVLHSSIEKQAHAVWKEIEAERFSAGTQSGHLDVHQESCVWGSTSGSWWSESNSEAGGRLDESMSASKVTNGRKQTSRLHAPNVSAFLNSIVNTTAVELPSFVENHSPSPKFKIPKPRPRKLKVDPQNSMFPESYLEQFSPMNPARKDSDNSVLDYEQKKPASLQSLETNGNSKTRTHCHKKSGIIGCDSRALGGQINHSIGCQSEILHTSCQSISPEQQNIPHSPASVVHETFTQPCARSSTESMFDSAGYSRHIYKHRGCNVSPTQIALKTPGNRASTPIRTVHRFSEFCLDDTVSTICPADSMDAVGRLNDVRDRASPEMTQADTLVADSDSFEEVNLL